MGKVKKTKAVSAAPEGRLVLALDVSSVCVGWAVFHGHELVEYGKWVSEGDEHGERIMNFGEWLLGMLSRYKPDDMVTEAPYAGRRRYTYGVLMMYLSVVLGCHFRWFAREMPQPHRIAAHAVKRALRMPKGQNHEQNKHLMVLKINELYGLQLKFKPNDKTKRVTEDDVADAIAVGRAHLIRQEP